jgi:hypothetical protein
VSNPGLFNEQIHERLREGYVQSDMNEAVEQLLSDLMINYHIPVTPSSPLHIDNNLLDPIILPEYSQQAGLSTADTGNSNPLPSVHETHNPNPTHSTPFSLNRSRNEPDIDPPSDRIRPTKYPLRFREPKRQWDESLLSKVEPYEPETYEDAMTSPHDKRWKQAIQTWSITTPPPDRASIKSRRIFKVKPGVRGADPRYKSRLVAKGYSQRFGIDYDETFASVAKQDTLRMILSFVAVYDLEMHQLDIKTAFLYGELDQDLPGAAGRFYQKWTRTHGM